MVIISHVFNTARKDWSLPVENPIANIRKPASGQHRERRLAEDELSRLINAADDSKASMLSFCIIIAVETGMRAGEIVPLVWEQIDLANSVIRVDMTKNGASRAAAFEAPQALRSYRAMSQTLLSQSPPICHQPARCHPTRYGERFPR